MFHSLIYKLHCYFPEHNLAASHLLKT